MSKRIIGLLAIAMAVPTVAFAQAPASPQAQTPAAYPPYTRPVTIVCPAAHA